MEESGNAEEKDTNGGLARKGRIDLAEHEKRLDEVFEFMAEIGYDFVAQIHEDVANSYATSIAELEKQYKREDELLEALRIIRDDLDDALKVYPILNQEDVEKVRNFANILLKVYPILNKEDVEKIQNMAKRAQRKLPYHEQCICKLVVNEKPRTPQIRRQASLYPGVIEEVVCDTCGAWWPTEMEW